MNVNRIMRGFNRLAIAMVAIPLFAGRGISITSALEHTASLGESVIYGCP
jgi:hypothetical protein